MIAVACTYKEKGKDVTISSIALAKNRDDLQPLYVIRYDDDNHPFLDYLHSENIHDCVLDWTQTIPPVPSNTPIAQEQ